MKSLERLRKYLLSYRISILVLLFVAITYVICSILIPYFVGRSIDEIIAFIDNNGGDYRNIVFFISLIILFTMLSSLFQYLFDSFISITVEKISKRLKDDVFIKIHSLPIKYIDTHLHGELLSYVINDCDNISVALNGFFKQFYEGIITILVTIVFMFCLNWMLGLVVLVLTPLSFLISYLVAKNSNRYFEKQINIQGKVVSDVLEKYLNIELVKSYNNEDISFKEFEKINKEYYIIGQKAQFFSSLTNPSTRLINNSVYAIVEMVGALLAFIAFSSNSSFILFGTSCTIGVISSFLQYANQFAKPFNNMSSVISDIQQGFQSFEKINSFLNENDDIDFGDEIIKNDAETIYFNKISFSYDDKTNVLNDFSLIINKGMKIALVGPTGCGKTTLVNLILRFYDVNSGAILLGDRNINSIKKSSLRKNFGLVLQDSWIFKGTILDNIKYAKLDASFDEVVEATKKAHAFGFISRLPNGFNTIVDDDSSLSEGEKQLISLARVMLLNSDFIILDEATSNIDSRNEIRIIKAFNELIKNKTSLVIAHRLSTIMNSDLIIVLKEGKIIEMGKHNELINKNGFYKKLFNAQFE